MESICPSAAIDFTSRAKFLEAWRKSPYDLVWFVSRYAVEVSSFFGKLSAGKAPTEGDPLDFLQKCKDGEVSEDDFQRVGAALAVHYIITTEKDAKMKAAREKERAEQEEAREEWQSLNRLDISEEQRAADDVTCGDEDGMDVDKEMAYFFQGVDLTRVDWDAEYIQAFLNIDTSLDLVSKRPESGQKYWIDVSQGLSVFITKKDTLADVLAKILCIN